MGQKRTALFGAAILAVLTACSHSDRAQAEQKAAAARQKAKQEAKRLGDSARKLGREARLEARELNQKMDQAVDGKPNASGGTSEAEEKLRRGEQELREAGGKAVVKLSAAATVARVKAKLAQELGVSSATDINVDARGPVVTLRGTVVSDEQKRQASEAAREVDGRGQRSARGEIKLRQLQSRTLIVPRHFGDPQRQGTGATFLSKR